MVVHEQKDPLFIFKFEAFELFKQISSINKDVNNFLMKRQFRYKMPGKYSNIGKMKRVAERTTESRGGETSEEEYHTKQVQATRERSTAGTCRSKNYRNDPCPLWKWQEIQTVSWKRNGMMFAVLFKICTYQI